VYPIYRVSFYAMNAPTERDIKILFARSLNQCAFPGCISCIASLSDEMVGDICHIKAKSPDGPRYDASQSDAERHAYNNLILLCRNHHKVVDDKPAKYTVSWLLAAKNAHEQTGPVEISQDEARQARKLLAAYLEIQADDESQVMANSSDSVQAKKIAIKKSKKSTRKSTRQTIIGDGNVVAGGNMIHTEKVVHKNVTQPGPQHISEDQAYEVKKFIDELAQIDVDSGRPDSHRDWYSWLYKKFRVTSYKTIPVEKYDAVIIWLRQKRAISRSKLRRPANALWRDQLYGAIYGKWRVLGFQKESIYPFALEHLKLNKPITSLKDLGEQNLKKLYDKVIRMRP